MKNKRVYCKVKSVVIKYCKYLTELECGYITNLTYQTSVGQEISCNKCSRDYLEEMGIPYRASKPKIVTANNL